jgi:hypothetical protein
MVLGEAIDIMAEKALMEAVEAAVALVSAQALGLLLEPPEMAAMAVMALS